MMAAKPYYRSLSLLIGLNLLVKPLWIFGIDRPVQNIVGHEAYGTYFALFNLTLILNILLDMGITPFLNRSVAAHPEEGPALFLRALRGKLLLTISYGVIVTLIALSTGIRDIFLLSSLILLQVMTGFNMFFRGYLSASQLFTSDAVVSVTDKFLVIIMAGTLLLFPGTWGGITVDRFVWIQILALVFSIVLSLVLLLRHGRKVRIPDAGPLDRALFMDTLPYAVNIFLMGVLARSDGYLLERLHPDGAREAGIYAMGFRLLDAFNMVGWLFAGFLLPWLARHGPDKKTTDELLLMCRHFLLFTGCMVVAFVAADASWVDRLLYHDDSPAHARVILVSLSALPFLSLIHIYGTLLTAMKEIRSFLRITLVMALLSMALNILLIPRLGALGCALAALASQAAYALIVTMRARHTTGIPLHLPQLLVVCAISAIFFGVVRSLHVHAWPLIPFSALAAMALLFIYLRVVGLDPRKLMDLFIRG